MSKEVGAGGRFDIFLDSATLYFFIVVVIFCIFLRCNASFADSQLYATSKERCMIVI